MFFEELRENDGQYGKNGRVRIYQPTYAILDEHIFIMNN